MNAPKEAYTYDFAYRSVARDDRVLVYTNKDAIELSREFTFDIDAPADNALDHLAASIVGGIMLHVRSDAGKAGIETDDLEGRMELSLANPLSALGVIGYDEPPAISRCMLTVYLYADLAESEFESFMKRSLEKCLMYQTMQKAFPLEVRFVQIL